MTDYYLYLIQQYRAIDAYLFGVKFDRGEGRPHAPQSEDEDEERTSSTIHNLFFS